MGKQWNHCLVDSLAPNSQIYSSRWQLSKPGMYVPYPRERERERDPPRSPPSLRQDITRKTTKHRHDEAKDKCHLKLTMYSQYRTCLMENDTYSTPGFLGITCGILGSVCIAESWRRSVFSFMFPANATRP